MARRVFFSFHYKKDSWRAGNVRNSGVISNYEENTFIDAAEWEKLKLKGDSAVEQWIDGQLHNTSVTVVLIGSETSQRKWVKYEIRKSHSRDKGMIGIYIHNIKDSQGYRATKGNNPFALYKDTNTGVNLSAIYPTYDWVNDNGRENLADWIEEAAKKAGR